MPRAVGKMPASEAKIATIQLVKALTANAVSAQLTARSPGLRCRVSSVMAKLSTIGRPMISPVGSRKPCSKARWAAPSQCSRRKTRWSRRLISSKAGVVVSMTQRMNSLSGPEAA